MTMVTMSQTPHAQYPGSTRACLENPRIWFGQAFTISAIRAAEGSSKRASSEAWHRTKESNDNHQAADIGRPQIGTEALLTIVDAIISSCTSM